MRFIRGRRSRDRRRCEATAVTPPRVAVVAVLFAMALEPFGRDVRDRRTDGPSLPDIEQHFSVRLHRHRGACRRSLLDLARPADRVFRQAAAEAGQRLRETRIHVRGGNLAWPSYRDQLREDRVDLVGLNCATCHVGSIRDMPGAGRRFVVGMPANQMDLQGYARFLTACASDPRFNASTLIDAIRTQTDDFGFFDAFFYRFFVISRTCDAILERARENAWFDARPPFGPGRVDTFNPYKVLLGLGIENDRSVGTVDLPSLWNQRMRQGLWLHWATTTRWTSGTRARPSGQAPCPIRWTCRRWIGLRRGFSI